MDGLNLLNKEKFSKKFLENKIYDKWPIGVHKNVSKLKTIEEMNRVLYSFKHS